MLAFPQFREATGQAGVPQSTGAEFAGAADHGNTGLPVGMAVAHQGQRFHAQPPGQQPPAQQGATEVFPVAVAQQ